MNLFNALNGKEAKQAIINEVIRALDNDSEFREHLTFPRVSWHWKLEMNIYPRTPEEKVVEVTGEAIQMARNADGTLMPVVAESESHVREVLQSTPREMVAQGVVPDAVREAEGLPTVAAPVGGPRVARPAIEVGRAARDPILSPGLNR